MCIIDVDEYEICVFVTNLSSFEVNAATIVQVAEERKTSRREYVRRVGYKISYGQQMDWSERVSVCVCVCVCVSLYGVVSIICRLTFLLYFDILFLNYLL